MERSRHGAENMQFIMENSQGLPAATPWPRQKAAAAVATLSPPAGERAKGATRRPLGEVTNTWDREGGKGIATDSFARCPEAPAKKVAAPPPPTISSGMGASSKLASTAYPRRPVLPMAATDAAAAAAAPPPPLDFYLPVLHGTGEADDGEELGPRNSRGSSGSLDTPCTPTAVTRASQRTCPPSPPRKPKLRSRSCDSDAFEFRRQSSRCSSDDDTASVLAAHRLSFRTNASCGGNGGIFAGVGGVPQRAFSFISWSSVHATSSCQGPFAGDDVDGADDMQKKQKKERQGAALAEMLGKLAGRLRGGR